MEEPRDNEATTDETPAMQSKKSTGVKDATGNKRDKGSVVEQEIRQIQKSPPPLLSNWSKKERKGNLSNLLSY